MLELNNNKKYMSKINKILVGLIVVLAIAIIVIGAVWYLWGGSGNNYYAVYLDTGDLYFGTLSRFPHMTLSNVLYLQKDPQSQSTSLQDFSKVAWGPENKIEINSNKVVWMAKISDISQLIPILSGKSMPASQPQQNDQGVPSGSATSTPSR